MRSKKFTGVFLIDLDNFKTINDTLGHAAGDGALREVARRLSGVVRAMDSVIRLGGDEFVIVCANVTSVADLRKIADKVVLALQAPIAALPNALVITCSVGIVATASQQSPDDLLAHADTAMYLAKKRGKNQFEVYEQPVST